MIRHTADQELQVSLNFANSLAIFLSRVDATKVYVKLYAKIAFCGVSVLWKEKKKWPDLNTWFSFSAGGSEPRGEVAMLQPKVSLWSSAFDQLIHFQPLAVDTYSSRLWSADTRPASDQLILIQPLISRYTTASDQLTLIRPLISWSIFSILISSCAVNLWPADTRPASGSSDAQTVSDQLIQGQPLDQLTRLAYQLFNPLWSISKYLKIANVTYTFKQPQSSYP